jgi:hypothetical protein
MLPGQAASSISDRAVMVLSLASLDPHRRSRRFHAGARRAGRDIEDFAAAPYQPALVAIAKTRWVAKCALPFRYGMPGCQTARLPPGCAHGLASRPPFKIYADTLRTGDGWAPGARPAMCQSCRGAFRLGPRRTTGRARYGYIGMERLLITIPPGSRIGFGLPTFVAAWPAALRPCCGPAGASRLPVSPATRRAIAIAD